MGTTKWVLVLVAMTAVVAVCGGSTYAFAQEEVAKCTDGYQPDPRMMVPCVPICDAGYGKKWDAAAKTCVSVCNGDAGYQWDSESRRCKSRCERGQEWDVNTMSCECPAGQAWYSEYRMCLATGEFLRRADADKAEAKARQDAVNARATCPEGTKDFGSGCLSRCTGHNGFANGHWDPKAKTCVCPPGSSWESIGQGGCF